MRGRRNDRDTPPGACEGAPQGDSHKGIPAFDHNRPLAINGEEQGLGQMNAEAVVVTS